MGWDYMVGAYALPQRITYSSDFDIHLLCLRILYYQLVVNIKPSFNSSEIL